MVGGSKAVGLPAFPALGLPRIHPFPVVQVDVACQRWRSGRETYGLYGGPRGEGREVTGSQPKAHPLV